MTSGRTSGATAGTARLREIASLPGPRGTWLLGNLLQVKPARAHTILNEWADRHGPLYHVKLAGKPVLVVADDTLIHEVLRNRPEAFSRRRALRNVILEVGVNGVFIAEGADWRRQRKLAMFALNTQHLRAYFERLDAVTARLQRRWEAAARDGTVIDAQRDLMRYTVDVTSGLALGHDLNTLEQQGAVIQDHMELLFPGLLRRLFAPFPYWRWVRLPADRALDRAVAEVVKLVRGLVADCRARLAADADRRAHPANLLEAMIVAQDDEAHGFTDDEIIGNALTMLMAGEDTTANTLAWMMDLLIEHPDVQRRLQAEVDAVLGDAPRPADYAQADRLPYLDAVAHEAMRLKPVGPFLAFDANEEVDVGGVRVPKHSAVFVLTSHTAKQPGRFSDPLAFRPERWLEGRPADLAVHEPRAFMPFGAGPRFCPGRHLAMLEIRMVTAMLARHFDVLRAPGTGPAEEVFAFTMMPRHLYVTLRARAGRDGAAAAGEALSR